MDMQNVSNLQIPEGDVRTIHDKDNRLLWGKTTYSVKYAGDTLQQTYSGKNILNITGKTSYGVTGTVNTDGTVTISGTGTTTDGAAVFGFNGTLPAGTYTLSLSKALPRVLNMSIASGVSARITAGNTSATVTTTQAYSGFSIYYGIVNGTTYNEAFKMQLVAGSTPDYDFEPYTAGPAPNPEYPQDVRVVTGEQNVNVCGKNYLNLVGVTNNGVTGTMNSDGSFTLTGKATATGGFRFGNGEGSYPPAGTYTFTIEEARDSNVALVINSGGENITARITPGNTSATVTIASAAIGMGLFVVVTNGVTYNETFRLQLTAGSTPDYDFEPYQNQSYTIDLGSTELCKVGGHQDYIYKSGDDWYVHKSVKKINLNGAETWQNSGTNTFACSSISDYATSGNTGFSPFAKGIGNVTNGTVFSNTAPDQSFAFGDGTIADRLYWKSSNFANANEAKSWLQSNTPDLYYAFATPTDTKITDATLVAQLNAVHQWATRYGYNTIVSGDLPIILQRDSLQ